MLQEQYLTKILDIQKVLQEYETLGVNFCILEQDYHNLQQQKEAKMWALNKILHNQYW